MANEATLVTRTDLPVSMIIADGTAVLKGTVMLMSDPNTCAPATGAADTVAGIMFAEKIASDGNTQAAIFKRGRFKMKLSGSCTVGDPVVTDTFLNHVKSGAALTAFALSRGRILGRFLETGATGETVLVEVEIESGGSGV